MGGKNFTQGKDIQLETTRARFSNVLKRHTELADCTTRNSNKLIFKRLQKEFEVARVSQTQEICLDGEQWNDGLLATLRERVHMEAERKTMAGDSNIGTEAHFQKKMICCLEGARIGIQFKTFFAGEPCELYHCVLESKSFLEKMTVHEHAVPFFLPIRETETDLLSSNAIKFIDHIGDLLQAYVHRREQVNVMKELYGDQIAELYHNLLIIWLNLH